MKKLISIFLLTFIFTHQSQAEQSDVLRLHVTEGSFEISGLISPIGAFTLETGSYQGDPQDIINNHIVTWDFGFFGPVYNYTALENISNAADPGGLAPSGFVDSDTASIQMDMSSWFAYWNGTHFNQGSPIASGSYDPQTGSFTLNWEKTIIGGAFDGQTGVWQISGLAETGLATSYTPTLTIDGGNDQECNQPDAALVNAQLSIDNPENIVFSDITWTLDNQVIASNVMDQTLSLALGEHLLVVEVFAEDGTSRITSQPISVADTTPPELQLGFIDLRTGARVDTISSDAINLIRTHIVAIDACDAAPEVSATGGYDASHGDILRIQSSNGSLVMTVDSISLSGVAKDAVGNMSEVTAVLQITQ